MLTIAVVGGDDAGDEALKAAEEVGRDLGRRGCVLICGGRGGVMEAACRGARAEGGHTIGVLPGSDRSEANPHVEFPIATNMASARNLIVVLSADAVIAIDGSYGTLSEIAHAHQIGRPVIGLATWSLALAGRPDTTIIEAKSAAEAVSLAIAAAEKSRVATKATLGVDPR